MNNAKVERVWGIVRDVILERLTRKPRRKRQLVAESKLLEWVECIDPEIELADLSEHSKERVENLEELV